jgi:hypothetical protein
LVTDGQAAEIEVRPVTMIFQGAVAAAMKPPIEYPGAIRLTPEYTVYHAERVQKLDPDFWMAWRVFCDNTSPATPVEVKSADDIRKCGTAAVHLMGLIDTTLKFHRLGKRVVWVYPESCMHPGWQVGLGDLAIWFGLRGESPCPTPATGS